MSQPINQPVNIMGRVIRLDGDTHKEALVPFYDRNLHLIALPKVLLQRVGNRSLRNR